MSSDKIVQFVFFETTLNSSEFALQWEQNDSSSKNDEQVTLQQSEKKGSFRYISQHRGVAGEFRFRFKKGRRSPHNPAVEIRSRQLGGYRLLGSQKLHDIHTGEIKIFAFLLTPHVNLKSFGQLISNARLNLYEAYYENCIYSHILEYFVKSKDVTAMLEKLKEYTAEPYRHNAPEIGVYTEFDLQESHGTHS